MRTPARSYASDTRAVAAVLTTLRTGLANLGRYAPNPKYAEAVQRVGMLPAWRRQVVEWLTEVAAEFRFDGDTTAHAINFFDRLLSAVIVPPSQLQLSALACLFIASKLLELRPLRMRDIRKYFSAICSHEDVRKAEMNILVYLQWDTNAFTPITLIRTILHLVPDLAVQAAVQQLAEQYHAAAMLDYGMLAHSPAAVGLACVMQACTARGFDVSPLITGLASHGVDIPLSDGLIAAVTDIADAVASPPPSPALMRSAAASPASTATLDHGHDSAATPSSAASHFSVAGAGGLGLGSGDNSGRSSTLLPPISEDGEAAGEDGAAAEVVAASAASVRGVAGVSAAGGAGLTPAPPAAGPLFQYHASNVVDGGAELERSASTTSTASLSTRFASLHVPSGAGDGEEGAQERADDPLATATVVTVTATGDRHTRCATVAGIHSLASTLEEEEVEDDDMGLVLTSAASVAAAAAAPPAPAHGVARVHVSRSYSEGFTAVTTTRTTAATSCGAATAPTTSKFAASRIHCGALQVTSSGHSSGRESVVSEVEGACLSGRASAGSFGYGEPTLLPPGAVPDAAADGCGGGSGAAAGRTVSAPRCRAPVSAVRPGPVRAVASALAGTPASAAVAPAAAAGGDVDMVMVHG